MIVLRVARTHVPAIHEGCPWVMRHQLIESSEWVSAEPCIARVETDRGDLMGIGMLNPHSHITCRMLSKKDEPINQSFFEQRILAALARRAALFDVPYFRMVHAEADFLPGLVVDRFDDILVIQVASAVMELLQPVWLAALENIVAPNAILLRNDFSPRNYEGLSQGVTIIKGEIPPLVPVHENGCIYFADLVKGQKTGWFYDMRDNRKMIADMANGKSVLDVFSHSGGFGLLAAKAGATSVTMVDGSVLALKLAVQAAEENKLGQCDTIKGDAVWVMQELAAKGKRYDIVIADPPAYVKTKKDIVAGLKGYEKVAMQAATLVNKGGMLFTASCSHHAGRSAFTKAVMDGIAKAGRTATIVKQTGASRDHPRHPELPQSEYLKGLLLQMN